MIFEHDGHRQLLARFASSYRQFWVAFALHGFSV
jgi:hypothetical protein